MLGGITTGITGGEVGGSGAGSDGSDGSESSPPTPSPLPSPDAYGVAHTGSVVSISVPVPVLDDGDEAFGVDRVGSSFCSVSLVLALSLSFPDGSVVPVSSDPAGIDLGLDSDGGRDLD